MITSAANRPWIGDIPIPDHEAAGLPSPSIIRPVKITTIETRHAEQIGNVTSTTREAVTRRIRAIVNGMNDQ